MCMTLQVHFIALTEDKMNLRPFTPHLFLYCSYPRHSPFHFPKDRQCLVHAKLILSLLMTTNSGT